MRMILLLALAFWWAQPLETEPVQTLRVVTWNLQWFPGGRLGAYQEEQAKHIEQVREKIRQLKPEILLLQEVRSLEVLEQTLQPLGKEWKVAVVSRFKQGSAISRQQLAIAQQGCPSPCRVVGTLATGVGERPRGYAYASFLGSVDSPIILYHFRISGLTLVDYLLQSGCILRCHQVQGEQHGNHRQP